MTEVTNGCRVYSLFSTRETAGITGLSSTELARLDEAGIAKATKFGKERVYNWQQLRRLHKIRGLLKSGEPIDPVTLKPLRSRSLGKPCPVIVLVPKVSDEARGKALGLFQEALRMGDGKGAIRRAEALYEQAIGLNPGFADAYVQLGRLLLLRNQDYDAEALWRKALSINQWHAGASYNLGYLHRERGEHATALELFERSATVDARFADVHWMIADCATILGHKERAREAWVMYIRLSDDEKLKRDAFVRATKLVGA